MTFSFIAPCTYYDRAYLDANRNGKWDTGNLAAHLQPEDVFYYPKKIVLRKNWDVDQDWALFETPVDAQKPNDIKKNKPKNRDRYSSEGTSGDDEEEYYDDEGFGGNNFFNDGSSWGNGSQYNNAGSSSSSSRRNGGGGFKRNPNR